MALELGPCGVYFGDAGSEESLGKTHGGVTVRISDDSVDLKSDQHGSSPEDVVITGTTVEVELSLAEIDFDNIALALNQDTFGNASNPDGVAGEGNVGTSLLSNGKSLILKKYVNGQESSDRANWVRFPKAAPTADVELSYDAENQRVMKVKFRCFPDTVSAYWGGSTQTDKEVFYIFGDETAQA